MTFENILKERLGLRTVVVLSMILMAAVLRIAPHPWNFTPVGAMALFSGALVRDRRLAFLFPLLALLAGDLFVGFHKLMPVVYASYLVNVAIGLSLRDRRTAPRVAALTLAGAVQFFIVTNFGVWAILGSFPRPFFWNTLAGDALYAALLFGGFALAERLLPALRQPAFENT